MWGRPGVGAPGVPPLPRAVGASTRPSSPDSKLSARGADPTWSVCTPSPRPARARPRRRSSAPAAHAFRLPAEPRADRRATRPNRFAELADRPDRVRRRPRAARRRPRPGVVRFIALAAAQRAGRLLGQLPLREVGKGSASLHAENRAVDWHLDVVRPGRQGARGAAHRAAARARQRSATRRRSRAAWASRRSSGTARTGAPGMTQFKQYSPCFKQATAGRTSGSTARPRTATTSTSGSRRPAPRRARPSGASGLARLSRAGTPSRRRAPRSTQAEALRPRRPRLEPLAVQLAVALGAGRERRAERAQLVEHELAVERRGCAGRASRRRARGPSAPRRSRGAARRSCRRRGRARRAASRA